MASFRPLPLDVPGMLSRFRLVLLDVDVDGEWWFSLFSSLSLSCDWMACMASA